MGAVAGVGSVQPGALGTCCPPSPGGEAVLDHCSSAVQQLKEKLKSRNSLALLSVTSMAMDTSRCDVSVRPGEKNILCLASKSYYRAPCCAAQISAVAQISGNSCWWGWSRSCISGCTGAERCSSEFAAARKFLSLLPCNPGESAAGCCCPQPWLLRGSAVTPCSGRRTRLGPGRRQRLSLQKMSRHRLVLPLQQPPGWPRHCGCCGQLHHLPISSPRCCWL